MVTSTSTAPSRPLQASSVASSEPPSSKGVSSRRLKKREIDRRCQRQARERTKSRIAYLEGLVEDFRRQDASGQVATLMKQLAEMERERNVMSKTLKDIQKAMESHQSTKLEIAPSPDTKGFIFQEMVHDTPPSEIVEQKPDMATVGMDQKTSFPPAVEGQQAECSPSNTYDLVCYSGLSHETASTDMLLAPQVIPVEGAASPESPLLVQAADTEIPLVHEAHKPWPFPPQSCPCCSTHGWGKGKAHFNRWRYANDVLSERFNWNGSILPADDACTDDTPIRALVEGWDALDRQGNLHPSWHILRRIDETLFLSCSKVERLAILRAMHSLLQFHTESTRERYLRLPPWYMRRPSQSIAHSYATEFFAWPGVRERFVFNEHHYCGNIFWHLFARNLRVLWPYEFRDCYTREIETGLYKVSPLFDQRISDIKCWTMGPDIFQRFPELCTDIPAYSQIPAPMSTKGQHQSVAFKRHPAALGGRVQEEETNNHPQDPPMGSGIESLPTQDAFVYPAFDEAGFAAMCIPEDLNSFASTEWMFS